MGTAEPLKCVKTALKKFAPPRPEKLTLNTILTLWKPHKINHMKAKSKNIDPAKAFKYYCKGLNSKEIAKLLDCSHRTIQNHMSAHNWKAKRAAMRKAKE